MKKLFLLLVFSFSLSFAQAPLPVVDNDLQDTFEQLVERSSAHGHDYLVKLNAAGFTGAQVVDSLPNGDLGKYVRSGSQFHVLISKVGLEDKTSLEWTLAHELGHGLGMNHSEEKLTDGTYPWSAEIMSGSGTTNPRHLIYQIMNHPNHSPGIWERYFAQL